MIGRRGKKLQVLNDLRNPNCRLCSLWKGAVNVCVFGRGNPIASIHLIGEAPGAAEAKIGKPFMGRAGKLLNDILKELDMYYMVYISNVVRCRPPKNRKPTPEEIQTCSGHYLSQEINALQCKVMVLMGRTAIDHFYSGPFTRGVASNVGTFTGPKFLIPTWHPSYILHTNSKQARKELTDHLALAKSLSLQ